MPGHHRAAAATGVRHGRLTSGSDIEKLAKSLSRMHEQENPEKSPVSRDSKSIEGVESMINLQRSVSALEREGSLKDGSKSIVDSHWFNGIVTTTVVLNTIQLGMEADTKDNPDFQQVWIICENIVTAIFFLELNIKLFCLRCSYFHDKANWLDMTLTMMGVVDCWVLGLVAGDLVDLQSMSLLRVMRLIRLVRVAKVASRIRPLMLVLSGLYQALFTTFWVFSVLVIVMYVFAVFCTEYIGHGEVSLYSGYSKEDKVIDEQEVMQNFNPHILFGSMGSSMLTLFNIAIGSEWQEVIRPIALKQPVFVALFLGYCILIVFGIMNVIVAIVVDNVLMESKKFDFESAQKMRTAKRQLLAEVQHILNHVDANGDGEVDPAEFKTAFYADPELQELLSKCDLPAGWTPLELLTMLDNSGDGILQSCEFTTNLFRLMDSDEFQRICILQSSLNQLKNLVRRSHNKIEVHISDVLRAIHRLSGEQEPHGAVTPPGIDYLADLDAEDTPIRPDESGEDAGAQLELRPSICELEENRWQILEASEAQQSQLRNPNTISECTFDLEARKVHQDLHARSEQTSATMLASDNGDANEAGAHADFQWQELGPDIKFVTYERISHAFETCTLAMKESFHREMALLTRNGETVQNDTNAWKIKARTTNDFRQQFDEASNVVIGVPGAPSCDNSSSLRFGSKSSPGIKPALPYMTGVDDFELPKFAQHSL